MNYLNVLLFFGLISVLPACRPASSEPPALVRQQYRLTGQNRCDTLLNKGVDVSVDYFLLDESADAGRNINDTLRHLLVNSITGWLDSSSVATHPEARHNLARAATLFAADYETMTANMGGLGGCWELQTRADTIYTSPKKLTIQINTYAYTGGAHPNSNQALYVFDRQTGRQLSLTDLVSDTTALLRVVEQQFRKQQTLLPQSSLEEHGYFLRDGQFFLPANIGINRKGMVFYYNPYEIAAYALGPIQITVPYEQLGGMLRID